MPKTRVCMPAAWKWLEGRRALQKKIIQGELFAKEMAEALNYNVASNVDPEPRYRERITVMIRIIRY